MARNAPNSFNQIFGTDAAGRAEADGPPSVHELFNATLRGELALGQFADALYEIHNIQITPAAVRLMSSTDATSGRLKFQDLQRALQDGDMPSGGAGRPMIISDQASAIISDNCGPAVPRNLPSQEGAARPSTDISADPFIKQQVKLERAAAKAKGAFSGNPIAKTNNASRGNPLATLGHETRYQDRGDDAYDSREMANTATRMFVAGEMSRVDYEAYLVKSGIAPVGEELRKLIAAHEQIGDGNFGQFMRAVNREMAASGA